MTTEPQKLERENSIDGWSWSWRYWFEWNRWKSATWQIQFKMISTLRFACCIQYIVSFRKWLLQRWKLSPYSVDKAFSKTIIIYVFFFFFVHLQTLMQYLRVDDTHNDKNIFEIHSSQVARPPSTRRLFSLRRNFQISYVQFVKMLFQHTFSPTHFSIQFHDSYLTSTKWTISYRLHYNFICNDNN